MPGVLLSNDDPRDHVLDPIIVQLLASLDPQEIANTALTPRPSPPIFDQGKTSICVASAAATMKNIQDNATDLNPFFLYNLRDDCETDSGMSLRNVMTLLYRFGIASISAYPIQQVLSTGTGKKAISPLPAANSSSNSNFTIAPDFKRGALLHPGRGSVHLNKALIENASKHKIAGYGRVYSIETLKHLFTLNYSAGRFRNCFGAVLVVLPVWSPLPQFWKPDPSLALPDWVQRGVADQDFKLNQLAREYHCTAIIDSIDIVTQTIQIQMLGPGFTIQNSWGKDWATEGRVSISFQDWEEHMMECFWSTTNVELAGKIKELVKKFASFKNFGNGNLEPDNLYFKNRVADTNFIRVGGANNDFGPIFEKPESERTSRNIMTWHKP